ncbi:MAG: ATP-binding protein [Pseudorhodobacter sp.]
MQADLADGPEGTIACLTLPARTEAIYAGLQTLLAQPPLAHLDNNLRGAAELALAEALNNIVEHGYAGQSGDIDIEIHQEKDGLFCQIHDAGRAFPGGKLPKGIFPDLKGELPEGGFGWALIHAVAEDICYERCHRRNRTAFRIRANQDEAIGQTI